MAWVILVLIVLAGALVKLLIEMKKYHRQWWELSRMSILLWFWPRGRFPEDPNSEIEKGDEK